MLKGTLPALFTYVKRSTGHTHTHTHTPTENNTPHTSFIDVTDIDTDMLMGTFPPCFRFAPSCPASRTDNSLWTK